MLGVWPAGSDTSGGDDEVLVGGASEEVVVGGSVVDGTEEVGPVVLELVVELVVVVPFVGGFPGRPGLPKHAPKSP